MTLSIVVCTYNRSALLSECISSLENQTVGRINYEIVVVDNNSVDDTAILIRNKFPDVRYIFERNIGLSHARNAGYKSAFCNWINYMDDDALAHNNYIEKIIRTIDTYNWDCFGGVFNRWFKFGQPKWFPEHFGTNKFDFDRTDLLPDNKFACGGVITIRKSVLEKLNGFNPAFGMTGKKNGYGEETELQIRMRQQGYSIGFNPEIQIDHLVAKYKLSVWWHLKAAWISEQASTSLHYDKKLPFFGTLLRILKASIKRFKYLAKLMERNYYWQNLVFDYAEPILRLTSSLYHSYFKFRNV
jgi:glucosyl-dolichyl phosphate glucuronosyltransferase